MPKVFDPEVVDRAAALYCADPDWRLIDAARLIGCSKDTAAKHLRARGIDTGRAPTGRPGFSSCGRCKSAPVVRGGKCSPCLAEYQRERHLIRKYGINSAEYDELLARQEGRCGLCGTEESRTALSDVLHVDHCAVTGKVRGLLCFDCNVALGRIGDTPAALRRALDYLKECC